jgi:hypothetical protein
VELVAEDEDQQQHGHRVEHDARVVSAHVAGHPFPDQPVQHQPVAEDGHDAHQRGHLPGDPLEGKGGKAEGDVEEFAEGLARRVWGYIQRHRTMNDER